MPRGQISCLVFYFRISCRLLRVLTVNGFVRQNCMYPACCMIETISLTEVVPGIYSAVSRSVAKFTDAVTIPVVFLVNARSMLAAQLAQLIPVMGSSIFVVATVKPER